MTTLRPNRHLGSHQGPPNVCRPDHAESFVTAGVWAAWIRADARQGGHPPGREGTLQAAVPKGRIRQELKPTPSLLLGFTGLAEP